MSEDLETLRVRLRRNHQIQSEDLNVMEEAEQLRHFLENLSADTRSMFYDHIQFLADNDAICHEEVVCWLEQYKATYTRTKRKDVRAQIVGELAKWWVQSGRNITKTLQHQNPTGKGDSDAIRFIREEYEKIAGRGIQGSTVKTYLVNLGY